jgi:hypothetical protein
MGKIPQTWSLMSDCWRVLKQDKKLLLLPLISGTCCLLLLASFAIPIIWTGVWRLPKADAGAAYTIAYYAVLFLFYFCNYFIVVFFNAAIVACATIRMGGGQPTLGDGLRVAAARLPVILGWALVSATVGFALRLIEDRSEKAGRLVSGLLGMGWTAVSFLVIPILVNENKNPIAALKDSTALLKKTWGQQVVSSFSFGLIFFLLALPGVALLVVGILAVAGGSWTGLIVCGGLAALYWIVLALIQSALHAIFQTALYLYARDGQVPEGFNPEVLRGALS